tara:strand:- start:7443 stop:7682 length:240 start_codon:yes stop_codon:yes gene_type:complete
MVKKIVIDRKPTKVNTSLIDYWVESGSIKESIEKQSLSNNKKITLDVSEGLHKKIKIYCTYNNIKIKDKLLEILEREFQ